MRNDYVDVTLLLDRSGSMIASRHDMEGGIQQFIENQRQQSGKTLISLFQFDTDFERVFADKTPHDCPKVQLVPRGGTALVDAMARCIRETGERFAAMPEAERPAKVIVVVITDGEENSSRHTTSEQLAALVREHEETYKWEFVYLGADHNAFAQAHALGIKTSNIGGFVKTSGGIRGMSANMNDAVNSYRNSGTPSVRASSGEVEQP